MIIQARCGSTRLPNKILMKLNNKTIVSIILDSLKFCKMIDEIVVATTNLQKDDKVVQLVKKEGVSYFRGSEKNVLKRYFECAKINNADLIVRLTADNPIVDPIIVDKLIKICKTSDCDYASNVLHSSFPIGFSSCEVFKFSILKQLYENQKDKLSKEHVTSYIRANPKKFKIREILAPKKLYRTKWRLTIDYFEDFQLLTEIFKKIKTKKTFFTYKELVVFLDANPELFELNKKYS